MADTSRLKNESLRDYQIRLCLNKDVLGLTWSDIRDFVVEQPDCDSPLSHDTIRKWFTVWNEGYQDGIDTQISDSEILEEVESKRIELQKMKYQMQDQKREFNNSVRIQARFDHIKSELLQAIHELNNVKSIDFIDPVFDKNANREGLALFSDWHFGLEVDNALNKFNEEIFRKRVKRLVEQIISRSKLQSVKNLHLFIGGDMVNGLIHITSRILATEDVIKQTMIVSEVIAECIAEFSKNFENVYVYSVRGNHDRVTSAKDQAVNRESFADIIPWFLSARLSNLKNVKIVESVDGEIVVADILGSTVFGVHGDKDRPSNIIENLTFMLKKFPDYVVYGHYHHNASDELHGIESIMNGSLCGADEYAFNIRKTAKPSQKLLIFEEGEGLVCTYSIRLDNA